jgi:two-component system chemotaxis response regulator CheB
VSEIKVFIVDDSALVRQVLSTCLENHPRIRVIGLAADPTSRCHAWTA